MNLKIIDYTIYVYLENNIFSTVKEVSNGIKCDKATVYKSINRLLKLGYLSHNNDKPKRFNVIKDD